jgi:hypothetical protein
LTIFDHVFEKQKFIVDRNENVVPLRWIPARASAALGIAQTSLALLSLARALQGI